MNRTPIIVGLPPLLRRQLPVERTPLVNGLPMVPLREMLADPRISSARIAAAVSVADVTGADDELVRAALSDAMATSFALFATDMLRGPKEPPYNGRFLLGRHHVEWNDLVAKYDRICVLAARDHGKSFAWTFAYPLWRAKYWPGCETHIYSGSSVEAQKFLQKISDEILNNPKLSGMRPNTLSRYWSTKAIRTRQGSVIRARGYDTRSRGGHPQYVICDDVLTDDDIYSETVRRKNIDFFYSAISNMVTPGGQLVVVGTPMAYTDLYGTLKTNKRYFFATYPARNADGTPLFPERYDDKALRDKQDELKSAARYAREFMCSPMSDEASLFPAKLFDGPDVRLPYRLGLPASYWESRGMLRYTGVDIAMSAEVGADYFVIFTVAVEPNGTRWIANITHKKGISFISQIELIKDEYYRMRPEVIHIEANQAQRVWGDEIVRTTDIPIRRFFTTGVGGHQPSHPSARGATQVSVNKHNLDRGVPSLRMALENRKWRIPRGDETAIEITDRWIGEMNSIGWLDGRVVSVGEHDDLPMACWMCDTAVVMGGIKLEFLETQAPPTGPTMAAPAPTPPDRDLDISVVEAHALSAVQTGQRVQVDADSYYLRVRAALHEYVDSSLECGEERRAVFAAEEIKRLDVELRANLALPVPSAYREDDAWRPREGAPKADDFS